MAYFYAALWQVFTPPLTRCSINFSKRILELPDLTAQAHQKESPPSFLHRSRSPECGQGKRQRLRKDGYSVHFNTNQRLSRSARFVLYYNTFWQGRRCALPLHPSGLFSRIDKRQRTLSFIKRNCLTTHNTIKNFCGFFFRRFIEKPKSRSGYILLIEIV